MSNFHRNSYVGRTTRFIHHITIFVAGSCMFVATTAMATLTVTSPADQTAFCLGDKITAGSLGVYSECDSESPSVSASVGSASVSMAGGPPNYSSTADVTLEESGWITVSASDDCDDSDSLDIAVVEFVSLAVSSPATSLGGDNWDQYGVVKQSGAVFVYAELIPESPSSGTDVAGNMITWSGSEYQDTVSPRIKAVPTTAPLEATIAAICCNGGAARKVWVVWATVTARFSNDKSSGNSASFPQWCSGDTLGAYNDLSMIPTYNRVGPKVELVGTILPSGAGAIVSSQWKFKQDVAIRRWYGSTSYVQPDLSGPDAWESSAEDDSPDGSDQFFLLDTPSQSDPSGTSYYKVQWNFHTYVEWKGQRASDDALWYAHVKAHAGGSGYVVDECEANNGNPNFDTSY